MHNQEFFWLLLRAVDTFSFAARCTEMSAFDRFKQLLTQPSEQKRNEFYNEWAQNYQTDMARMGYQANENTLDLCLRWLKPSDR